MPRLDGTGPMGQGPMTGRGMGPCAFCARCPYFKKPLTKKDELEAIEDEEKMLKQELEAVQKEKQDLKAQK
ncbi:DUF5320 domain-containing protein [Patescibacteria group bacterium]|nr:DUF5320 domain-containing protein [Patescibacteria group bacterium]